MKSVFILVILLRLPICKHLFINDKYKLVWILLCVVYNISNMRLFIISNRLPVKVTRSSDGKFVFHGAKEGWLQV